MGLNKKLRPSIKARIRKMGPDAAKMDTKHPERRKRITQVKAAHNKSDKKR